MGSNWAVHDAGVVGVVLRILTAASLKRKSALTYVIDMARPCGRKHAWGMYLKSWWQQWEAAALVCSQPIAGVRRCPAEQLGVQQPRLRPWLLGCRRRQRISERRPRAHWSSLRRRHRRSSTPRRPRPCCPAWQPLLGRPPPPDPGNPPSPLS